MIKTVMITGANSGIGKDTARQMAILPETELVYLGCRNPQRAEAAKKDLETATGRKIFEIVIMDVSDLDSVRSAVASLPEPIEGLVMNAGGVGGKNAGDRNKDGVTHQMATNVLGHVVLLEEMLNQGKLTDTAIYTGSEAARGVAVMGMARPKLRSFSVDELKSVANGSFFNKFDPMAAYGYAKLMANLWMSSLSRKHTSLRIFTMSPGGTTGTQLANDLPGAMRIFFKYIGMPMMKAFGFVHDLEIAGKRFVDALTDPTYKTGKFYASKKHMSGELVEQGLLFPAIDNEQYQDNASEALHRFIDR